MFLQKYVLIPLDIFAKYQQNRDINERRDAWLTLLACDEPEKVVAVIEKYPELYELDRNTVQYMMDEQQEMIDAQKETIDSQQETIDNICKGGI